MFHVIVIPVPYTDYGYVEMSCETLAEAMKHFGILQELTAPDPEPDENGDEVYVYWHEDTLLILDDEFEVHDIWNREVPVEEEVLRSVDFGDILGQVDGDEIGRIVGYQIGTRDCATIQGSEDDPFGLTEDQVLRGMAVRHALNWTDQNPDLSVFEVREGEMKRPEFLHFMPDALGVHPSNAVVH